MGETTPGSMKNSSYICIYIYIYNFLFIHLFYETLNYRRVLTSTRIDAQMDEVPMIWWPDGLGLKDPFNMHLLRFHPMKINWSRYFPLHQLPNPTPNLFPIPHPPTSSTMIMYASHSTTYSYLLPPHRDALVTTSHSPHLAWWPLPHSPTLTQPRPPEAAYLLHFAIWCHLLTSLPHSTSLLPTSCSPLPLDRSCSAALFPLPWCCVMVGQLEQGTMESSWQDSRWLIMSLSLNVPMWCIYVDERGKPYYFYLYLYMTLYYRSEVLIYALLSKWYLISMCFHRHSICW